MFKCENCGREFETPETWKEYRGECHGVDSYETVAGCPFCNSTSFHEVKDGDDE